jgi:hypothetical protein
VQHKTVVTAAQSQTNLGEIKMQQAYKFTRIVPNTSDRTDRFIAVQYLRVPRTIIYDTLHMRVRRSHAAEGAGGDYDIWH